MAENYAIAWNGFVSSATGTDYALWIEYALGQSSTHNWTVIATNGAGRIHIQCDTTGAQAVIHGTTTQLQFGYAPQGGITDPLGTPTASCFTGMRNITASTSPLSLHGKQCWLAEYEDALHFMVSDDKEQAVRWVAHFGRIMEYTDTVSDEALKIGGHGWTAGRARKEGLTGFWLNGSNAAAYIAHTQCFQVNSTTFQNGTYLANYAAASTLLNDISGKERLFPQPMILMPVGITAASSFIGYMKYVRLYKSNAFANQVLESNTGGSLQAWLGFIGDVGTTPNTNTFVLWSKQPTLI